LKQKESGKAKGSDHYARMGRGTKRGCHGRAGKIRPGRYTSDLGGIGKRTNWLRDIMIQGSILGRGSPLLNDVSMGGCRPSMMLS